MTALPHPPAWLADLFKSQARRARSEALAYRGSAPVREGHAAAILEHAMALLKGNAQDTIREVAETILGWTDEAALMDWLAAVDEAEERMAWIRLHRALVAAKYDRGRKRNKPPRPAESQAA